MVDVKVQVWTVPAIFVRATHVPGVVGIYRCLYEAYLNGSEEALLEALRSPKWVDT